MYPKSKDMNDRFRRLYDAFGEDLPIPYVFVDGEAVDWEAIYYNIDFLVNNKKRGSI
jgi:hypothetical protein